VFLNKNFIDMLSALSEAGAEFLIVGAHALSAHGYPRATGDLDLWVRPTKENAERVWQALEKFGAPRRNVTPEDFYTPDTVYQIGLPPQRIDFMTSIDGVDFDEAWRTRKQTIIEGLSVGFLGREQLLKNKRATGRPKDLFDVAWMEESNE
jgi:hypothetical protein